MQYPELHKRQSNVDGDIVMHKLPNDGVVRSAWIHVTVKSRKDLKFEKDIPKNGYVCSIQFCDGRPTKNNLVPTLFLALSTNVLPMSAKSRKPCKWPISAQATPISF